MMVSVDNSFGFVFPMRCGTRWVYSNLKSNGYFSEPVARHDFEIPNTFDFNNPVYMMVRNPYNRERSIYRWLGEIKKIDKSTTFEEYILNENLFNSVSSISSTYSNYIDKVNEFVKLENVEEFLYDKFNIEIKYNNQYHKSFDEFDDFTIYEKHPHLIEKVNQKYDLDFLNFNYEKF